MWAMKANAQECLTEYKLPPTYERSEGLYRVGALNMRVGSGKKYCVKTVLRNAQGKVVEILGRQGDWRLTTHKGKKLWVHKSLIAKKPKLPLMYLYPV